MDARYDLEREAAGVSVDGSRNDGVKLDGDDDGTGSLDRRSPQSSPIGG